MNAGAMNAGAISRRSVLAGGGLVVALLLPGVGHAQLRAGAGLREAFLQIAPDGTVTLVAPTIEIGQGVYTAHAQLIAEELGCRWGAIRVVAAPADETLYANPMMHDQLTVASSGIRGFYTPLRQAGASARIRLVAAAARRWGVLPGDCVAQDGAVFHRSSGSSLGFGALADAAAREPAPDPATLVLKPASAFTVIGHNAPRVDVRAKADGSAVYGIDIVRPNMKFAAVASVPVIGGRLVGVDHAPALAVSGVRAVYALDGAVAVMGDHSWAAISGLAALSPQWGGGDVALNSAVMERDLMQALTQGEPTFSKAEGDAGAVIGNARDRLTFDYALPFLAHAQMEPINTVVELTPDGCDLWLGTQAPTRVRDAAAAAAGLAPDQVRVHNQLIGGGFGRRSESDFVAMAVEIAKRAGVPVKMMWTREQDMRQSMCRPLLRHRVEVALDARGRPAAWAHRIAGGSVFARYRPQLFAKGVPDPNVLEGARELLYDVGAFKLDYMRHDPPLPVSWWRGVGPAHNMFVIEGTINALAHRAGVDRVAYRRELMRDSRARRVLDLAAEKAGWGSALPPRKGRGIAVQRAFGGYLACVIEAEVTASGAVKPTHVVLAVDCGVAINPDNVVAQLEGGVIFGLSAALWGRIDVAGGRIVQDNYNSYRVMRIDETPIIDVHLVQSGEEPGGIGEAGTAIVFPALADAIFDATGKRLRSLPFDRHDELASGTNGAAAPRTSSGVMLAAAARIACMGDGPPEEHGG